MSLVEVTRRMFGTSDKERDEGLKTPEDIERFDNISYGEHGKWNLLDVYRPKNKNGLEAARNIHSSENSDITRLPVIVSCHGGGWVYGDKDVYQYYCMSLAERGFAVVNYTYRLAAVDNFPASVFDTDAVFTWIYAHASEYGFDTENVYAVGDSAGANLLGIYINLMNDKSYVEKINNYIKENTDELGDAKTFKEMVFKPQQDIRIKAAAFNCGKYSFDSPKEKRGLKDMAGYLFENDGCNGEFDMIDVIAHINKKFPPAYIMTATGDFLMKEAGKLCNRLEDLGVSFEYHFYSDGDNPLGHVFHCNMKLDMAAVCNDDECRFFRKYIG